MTQLLTCDNRKEPHPGHRTRSIICQRTCSNSAEPSQTATVHPLRLRSQVGVQSSWTVLLIFRIKGEVLLAFHQDSCAWLNVPHQGHGRCCHCVCLYLECYRTARPASCPATRALWYRKFLGPLPDRKGEFPCIFFWHGFCCQLHAVHACTEIQSKNSHSLITMLLAQILAINCQLDEYTDAMSAEFSYLSIGKPCLQTGHRHATCSVPQAEYMTSL